MASDLPQRYKNGSQKKGDTNPHQQEEPDSHITSARNSSSLSSSSDPSNPSESTTHPAPSDKAKGWTPLNRRQSWDEQEMRHQMHERLLGPESGKETGFTELEGGK